MAGFGFAPPPGPPLLPFNPQQALQAFRPPPPMNMGGAPGMQMPQQQQQPGMGMGGLQQGGFALAQALGQRPDPNANANVSGFPVGGGPQGPSGGAMADQGSNFWDVIKSLNPFGSPTAMPGGGAAP